MLVKEVEKKLHIRHSCIIRQKLTLSCYCFSKHIYYDIVNIKVGGYMKYRKIIKDLREDHDYTQQEIAEKLGTSQTMYARYERGASEMPIRHLITLSKLYNVSTDYILGLK